MGFTVGNEEQEKSQLAKEVLDISNRAVSCVHLHRLHESTRPFIDWYLVLRVSENSELDVIRKQYRKLALLLHPDKNKHSKAETAFKLVSEAYFCLSDDARRSAFDSERMKHSCTQCIKISHSNISVKIRTPHPDSSRFSRIHKRFKDLRTKLKEETRIIEKCLTANNGRESGNAVEIPVFNPSDYQHKGYPHQRTINHKKLEILRSAFMSENKKVHSYRKNESPVFQCRSERAPFMSGSGRMRGQ